MEHDGILKPAQVAAVSALVLLCGAAANAQPNYTLSTLGGNGLEHFNGDAKPALEAQIGRVTSMVVDAEGRLWFADPENSLVRLLDRDGKVRSLGSVFPAAAASAAAKKLNLAATDIAIGPDGTFYFTQIGSNKVLHIEKSGEVSQIAGSDKRGYSGDGGPAELAQTDGPYGIAVDNDGVVYFADIQNRRIRRITKDGKIGTLAGGHLDLLGPTHLALDSHGNLLAVDGKRYIVTITKAGSVSIFAGNRDETALATYMNNPHLLQDGAAATSGALLKVQALCTDRRGSVYFVEDTPSDINVAGTRIRKVDPSGQILTIVGSLTPPKVLSTKSVDGIEVQVTSTPAVQTGKTAVNTTVEHMSAVGADNDGTTIYFAQGLGTSVLGSVDSNGILRVIAGNHECCVSGDGGATKDAQIMPNGLAVKGQEVYFADYSRVRLISAKGIIDTFAGGNSKHSFRPDETESVPASEPRLSAHIHRPYAVAFGPNGELFFSDIELHCVRKVTATGSVVLVAGDGRAGFSGDGGPASQARLNEPRGIAFDRDGNLYISDSANNRVRKVDTKGIISTFAGTGRPGFSGDDGPAQLASLSWPIGLAVTKEGNLLVADYYNDRIRTILRSGIIRTIAGGGAGGGYYPGRDAKQPIGDLGIATKAGLARPVAIAVDSLGAVVIADSETNRIRRVSPEGTIETIAGTGVKGFTGDSDDALGAALNGPSGLTIGEGDTIYFSDRGNLRIRTLTPTNHRVP